MMYIKRLFIISIITYLVAAATGRLFDHLYKKRWSTMFFETTDNLIKGSGKYDIIFIGNSRVHFGINPYYIDSITKFNSFNFGTGGADAQDIMLTSTLYLQQHPAPKLTIISLDGGALAKNEIFKVRYQYLFYLENDTINKYMKQAGFVTPLIKVFPFIKYSFFDEYNRTSLFIRGKQYPVFDHNIYKGFLNIDQHTGTMSAGVYNTKTDLPELSETAIIYLKRAVFTLQQAGSMVVFVSPPEKTNSGSRGSAFNVMADSIFNSIAREFHLRYLHFENAASFKDEYFVDDIHLNEPGSRIYSLQLADSIKGMDPFTK
ncbi:MAG: hypothetical protein ABI760_10620 [Ferruginibacter sp.]